MAAEKRTPKTGTSTANAPKAKAAANAPRGKASKSTASKSTASKATASKPRAQTTPKRTRYGYQRDGKWVIEPQFESANPFTHGLAAVQLERRWGYIDPQGNVVIEPRFLYANPFADGLFAPVEEQKNRPFYIDRSGKPAFVQRQQAADGLFAVNIGGSFAWDACWGYRDQLTGSEMISPRFASAQEFFGEYATASVWVPDVGGVAGVIDRSGEWVIQPEFTIGGGGHPNGAIVVRKEGEKFLYGVVHPVHGVVEPFAERRIKPDLSRRSMAYPPRTAEDEALRVQKALVSLTSEPKAAFPFRFYGLGVGDSEVELVYRLQFAQGVDVQAGARSLSRALSDAAIRTSRRVEGAFVLLEFTDVADFGAISVETDATSVLRKVHHKFPIVEVVNLTVSDCADSEWQRWSVDIQPDPDGGPMFGYS